MARRPDPGKREHMWTREDLKEIIHNLSLLSEHGVREFTNAPIASAPSSTLTPFLPHARSRNWSKPGNNSGSGGSPD